MKLQVIAGEEYCGNFGNPHPEHKVAVCLKCVYGKLICDGTTVMCNKCGHIIEDMSETYDLSDPISN